MTTRQRQMSANELGFFYWSVGNNCCNVGIISSANMCFNSLGTPGVQIIKQLLKVILKPTALPVAFATISQPTRQVRLG